MTNATDDQLIRAAAEGQQEAFNVLATRHRSYLLTVADSVLHNLSDAEDLVQDVLTEIWRKADRFDPAKASAKTWLITICRNRAIDRLRSIQSLHHWQGLAAHEKGEGLMDADTGEARELAAKIEAHAHFTPMQVEAWRCTYLLGMGNNEAARFLGIPESTYRMRLNLCRANVRRVLKSLEQPGSEIEPRKKAGRPAKPKPEPKPKPTLAAPTAHVSYLSTRGYWVARVRENGTSRYVGMAKTKTEALSKAIDALPRLTDNA